MLKILTSDGLEYVNNFRPNAETKLLYGARDILERENLTTCSRNWSWPMCHEIIQRPWSPFTSDTSQDLTP